MKNTHKKYALSTKTRLRPEKKTPRHTGGV